VLYRVCSAFGQSLCQLHGIILKIGLGELGVLRRERVKNGFVSQFVFAVCWVLMAACLAFEGLILAFEGFPYYEHLSTLIRILGFVWILTVISCFFYRRRTVLSIVGGGAIFLINSLDLWHRDPETHYLVWFLYTHSVELLFIAVSCTGAFIMHRVQATLDRSPAPISAK
jgi:hypothetical protein